MAQVATGTPSRRGRAPARRSCTGSGRIATRPGRAPTNKRVWASVQRTASAVIDDAFAEALRRDPARRWRWIVLLDGQRDQLKRVERAARKVAVEITIVLDIVHVLEYLWRAAYAFHADGTRPPRRGSIISWSSC
jgi:hypothetical protein